MTLEEYFGDWMKVIDKKELLKVTKNVNTLYKTKKCSPQYKDIFKAFHVTPYNSLHTVMLLQDPYANNMATGIAVGNRNDATNLSPSLEVLKEAAIDYTIPHYGLQFDNTLESWSEQGILMLNTALTVEYENPGSHSVLWRNFMIKLIKNLNAYNPGLIWVLWGTSAKSFKNYITSGNIVEEYHPAYYARNNSKIDKTLFRKLASTIKYHFDVDVKWYKEYPDDTESAQ